MNRQIQLVYPDTTFESTGYDALDRRVAVTNQAGIVTRFDYDKLGRLMAVTNAFGATPSLVTQYRYNQVGNLTNLIDGLNRTNKYGVYAMGRRTKETLPGTQAQSFAYDATGNLIRQTNFNGVPTKFQCACCRRNTRSRMDHNSSVTVFQDNIYYTRFSVNHPRGQFDGLFDSFNEVFSRVFYEGELIGLRECIDERLLLAASEIKLISKSLFGKW